MSKRLQYFNINGLGEAIRYILHYAGEEFEDVRFEGKDWPAKKDTVPYGQLPVYEEDGRMLNQSLAIARYVGAKANLVPTDLWEQAVLDAAVMNINDYQQKQIKIAREQNVEKRDQIKKEFFEETIDYYFSRFETQLKENNGFFGGKLSWADFILVSYAEATNLYFNLQIQNDYPTVKALMETITSLPGVKEYIENREPYVIKTHKQ